MAGSLDHRSTWSAQSVNYLESHDDRCWIDRITENARFDGRHPTHRDLQRTHLGIAILMCSLGTPMLSAGQDFIRSKHGLSNTYLQGDINALDYEQLKRFSATHEYCRHWIRFRFSAWGELLRLKVRPPAGYVRLFACDGLSAAAVLFNADFSAGGRQILFAANPHHETVGLSLEGLPREGWEQKADGKGFGNHGNSRGRLSDDGRWLSIDPFDCGLWVRHG